MTEQSCQFPHGISYRIAQKTDCNLAEKIRNTVNPPHYFWYASNDQRHIIKVPV